MVAKAFGAANLVVTDVSDERLKVARDVSTTTRKGDVVHLVRGISEM